MGSITAIIVIKNYPYHVLETLESIKGFADEILVGDIGISEELRMVLKTYSEVTIVEIREQTPYVELVREKLKTLAKGSHILFIDPDEIITPELKQKLRGHMNSCDYFSIPRKNIIFGKWIEHSRWWPDYQVRFFKKDAVTWPREIHKQPRVTGKEYKLEPSENLAIIHHNYESIDEYMGKAIRYAKSEAAEIVKNNVELTLTDTIKLALSEFISRFFAHEGYKDGVHGFTLALLQMFYSFLVYFYYWELKKYPATPGPELAKDATLFFKQGFKESVHWMHEKKLQKRTLKEKIASKLF